MAILYQKMRNFGIKKKSPGRDITYSGLFWFGSASQTSVGDREQLVLRRSIARLEVRLRESALRESTHAHAFLGDDGPDGADHQHPEQEDQKSNYLQRVTHNFLLSATPGGVALQENRRMR